MATIVKQWNGLPGRAGESLFVCYSWPEPLFALTPPNSVEGTHWSIIFFQTQDSANLAQVTHICSCSVLQKSSLIRCKIVAGWRV